MRVKIMKTAIRICVFFSALLAFGVASASSGSMRCDGSIIEANAYEAEVLAKCGEPDQRQGNMMFYIKGSMVYIVHILGGKVSLIETENKEM